jgi:hypothetical protein
MIKPSVGRIVWYRPAQYLDIGKMAIHDWREPLAAMVVWVWSESCVNLDVVDHNGAHHKRSSVTLHQNDGYPCDASPFCEWMPFQKGQAAKTDELEHKLKQ